MVIIYEATIRRNLKFKDEGGVACLSNEFMFEQLTLMGAKTTAWNEFSSTIASAVICLATDQRFNFLKMANHTRIYVSPYQTKKIFWNMKRVGKGFFGRDTPLFPTMMVQAQEELDEAVNEEMYDSLERATTSTTGLDAEHNMGNISKTQSKETPNEPSSPGTSSGGGPRRQDTMGDTIAQTRVLNLETIKIAQAKEISRLKKRAKRLEKKKKSRTHGLKRLYKFRLSARVESSNKESLGEEDSSKHRRKINNIDADKGLTLIDETTEDQRRINDEEMFGNHSR
nr:hypothetical protein [Tanacetum cinerariifolium]